MMRGMHARLSIALLTVLTLAVAWLSRLIPVRADEGMWLLDAFPSAEVARKYGFTPTAPWLEKVRLSTARLAQGCSGSFVSARGLVLTNHHCAHDCIEQLSTARKDLIAQGFHARNDEQEQKCPALEVNQLVSTRDVTQKVSAATAGKSGKDYSAALKAEKAKLEKECAPTDDVLCEIVELYHGGLYHLYKYRRFQDVRLVFAPELAAAFFGGDPDNFNFPRYDLDMALLRIYEGGKPATMSAYFPFSASGAQAGELTFVAGHPGSTSRELTMAELRFERDQRLPRRLLRLAELRGLLTEFQQRGKEQKRVSNGVLFGVENGLKALKGEHQALLDAKFWESKVKAEREFRARIGGDKSKQARYGGAWDAIAAALGQYADIYDTYDLLERGRGFGGALFGTARTLVRAADELPTPNETRLREYTDAALPGLKQELFSPAPIHPELEIEELTFGLTKLREILGADDPVVKKVLGKQSPRTLATTLVRGSRLKDVALRKRLFEGGKSAIAASKDPMIELVRLVDTDARAVRKRYEDEIESALDKAHEAIAKARFEIYGTSRYPDATFTLRLSYGAVRGWHERGVEIAPFTSFAGAFERHTGEAPFALPASFLKAKSRLPLQTPFNFVTTNDIIGGNSGSPVINQRAEIVGLIFDGNIHSLGGDYGFDERKNRAVAVHSSAILVALDQIYGAKRLAHELRGKQ